MKTKNLHPGATFDKIANRWKGQVRLGGKLKSVGTYDTAEAAAAAVAAAKAVYQAGEGGGVTKTEQAVMAHNQKKKYVYQSNDLLEAWLKHPSKHSFYEYRLFMCMLRCLHLRDQELGGIIVSVADFMPVPLESSYLVTLREACKSMLRRQLELPGGDGENESFRLRPIVISLDYVHSKRAVVGTFHPDLLNHLVQLKSRFTTGDVEAVMRLRSVNSQRYYWLLKNWADQYRGNAKTVQVDELRELTSGLDKYPTFSDYRSKVMLPALEELSEHDFHVQHQEIVQGRSVVSVSFEVKVRPRVEAPSLSIVELAEKVTPAVVAKPVVDTSDQFNQAYFVSLHKRRHKFVSYYQHLINVYGFTHEYAASILDADRAPQALMDQIATLMSELTAKKKQNRINDLPAYARQQFEKQFPPRQK